MSQLLDGEISLKDKMSPVLKKISEKLNVMAAQIPNMINAVDKNLNSMRGKMKRYETDIAAHQNRMLTNMKESQRKFINYIHSTPKEIEKANAKMTERARSLAMHQQNISLGLASLGAPGAYVGYRSAKGFMAFDQQMADLRARTLDNYGRQYKRQAISLGMSSRYSATEVGQAQNVLAKAGFSGRKLMALTPSAINLASANDMDMTSAAEAMIAAKNTFQLGDSLSELNRVVDTLSFTANKTNSDVKGLITAMNYSGSTAKEFGLTLEEHLFFSGKLKDFGMSDSTVGTSMNQFLERILSNDTAVETMRKRLGTDMYNRNSKGVATSRKNIFEVLESLRTGFAKINIEDRGGLFKDVSETRGRRALTRLLSIEPEKLEKARKEFMDLEAIRGYAAKMEKERLNSYLGQLEKLKSGFESLSIATGEIINDMGLLKWLNGVADKFGRFTDLFQDYNDALLESNGDLLKAYNLVLSKPWNKYQTESLKFIMGFRDGLDQVVQTFKEGYRNVLDFLGVYSKDDMKSLGEFTAKFIAFSAVLTPLGLIMLFVKNVTMGLYSSFALLSIAIKNSSNIISSIAGIFSSIKGVDNNKADKVANVIDAASGGSSGSKKSKGGKRSILAEVLGYEMTRNAVSQGSTSSDRFDFIDVHGKSLISPEIAKKQKVAEIISDQLDVVTGIGASTVNDVTASRTKEANLARKLSRHRAMLDAIGWTPDNTGTVSGERLGARKSFGIHKDVFVRFGKNRHKGLLNQIFTGDNAPMSSMMTSAMTSSLSSAIGDVSISGAGGTTAAANFLNAGMSGIHGASIFEKLGTTKDREGTASLSEAIGDWRKGRGTFDTVTGIGTAGVNDAPGKRTFGQRLKALGGAGAGFFGNIGNNYLMAMALGNEKVYNSVKSGAGKAGKFASGATKGLSKYGKLAGMVALEALHSDFDFGGNTFTADKDGKITKNSGKAARRAQLAGGLKSGAKNLGAKGLDLFKSGFASLISMATSFGSVIMTVVSTALSPFALILGSITVIAIALFGMLKKDGESWGEMFGRILKNITDAAMFLWTEVFVPFGQGLAESFGPTITMIQEAFIAMGERLRPMFQRIAAMFDDKEKGGLAANMKKFGEIAGWVFKTVLTPVINTIITALEFLAGLLGDIFELFTSLMNGDWSNLGRTILRVFVRIITGITNLLVTAIGSILERIPGVSKYGTDLINWGRTALDAEKWTNSIWSETPADEKRQAKFDTNKSYFDVQPGELKKKNGWDEIVSEIHADRANQSVMQDDQKKALAEIAAHTKATAKNTGDPCDTNLDGKKISKNQARHQAINRQQGNGRLVLRTHKRQGRVN